MGLTFEAGFSLWSSAYDKAHRTRDTRYVLPVSKSKRTPASLDKLKRRASKAFRGPSGPQSSHAAQATSSPTPARQSQFFRLPLAVREGIYGYVVGRHELLHILLRYRSSPSRWEVAYRRCGAGGKVEDCVLKGCREYHDVVKGSYYGYFDHVGGLFLTCRDVYEEASRVLYSQNTLEFDHPLSLGIFSRGVSPALLQSVRSVSIDLQRHIYTYSANNFSLCTSLHPDQWLQMWTIVSGMQGLEEIRVRFQLTIDGWMGWSEREVLEPLYGVKQPLKVFEVEMPALSDAKGCSDGEEEEERDAPFRLIKY
ncbi:hypothetical protein F5884DRAFT_810959 [Xylogone sp. PMI_703]|nr:hypothetical protein F5884DRAFT_810959 [Xylogone sp. PMI_703]